MRRVVITGMGSLTPIGNNTKTYSENLFKGLSGCDFITRFDATYYPTRFACELKDFDAGEFMNRKEARRLDPFTIYAMVVADEAINIANMVA